VIERLATEVLNDPVKLTQGQIGQVNENVTQTFKILGQDQKLQWLLNNIVQLNSVGSLLVFVTRKADCVTVHEELKKSGYKTGVIHGDMHQAERNDVIKAFKKQQLATLIATDVAARGLDISHIKTVINYDPARNYDTHVHRVGRTARAGNTGTAISLLTPQDSEYAGIVLRSIETTKQPVADEMLRLAMKDSSFRMTRGKDGKNIGYSDNDRGGFGSGKANNFVAEFVEYRSPAGSARNPYLNPPPPPKDPTVAVPLANRPTPMAPGAGNPVQMAATQPAGVLQGKGSSVMSDRAVAMRKAMSSRFGRSFVAGKADEKPKIEYTDPNVRPTLDQLFQEHTTGVPAIPSFPNPHYQMPTSAPTPSAPVYNDSAQFHGQKGERRPSKEEERDRDRDRNRDRERERKDRDRDTDRYERRRDDRDRDRDRDRHRDRDRDSHRRSRWN